MKAPRSAAMMAARLAMLRRAIQGSPAKTRIAKRAQATAMATAICSPDTTTCADTQRGADKGLSDLVTGSGTPDILVKTRKRTESLGTTKLAEHGPWDKN